MKKVKFLIPAFALVALTFAGCSDDDGGDDQPVVTKLALADPAQAALTFVATSPEAQVIALDTDASTVTVEQVLAEGESKAEWCVVTDPERLPDQSGSRKQSDHCGAYGQISHFGRNGSSR